MQKRNEKNSTVKHCSWCLLLNTDVKTLLNYHDPVLADVNVLSSWFDGSKSLRFLDLIQSTKISRYVKKLAEKIQQSI